MSTPAPDELRVPIERYLHDTARVAPLYALDVAASLHEMVHDVRALAVAEARIAGHSWQVIADTLGERKSTVHRRYHHLDPS